MRFFHPASEGKRVCVGSLLMSLVLSVGLLGVWGGGTRLLFGWSKVGWGALLGWVGVSCVFGGVGLGSCGGYCCGEVWHGVVVVAMVQVMMVAPGVGWGFEWWLCWRCVCVCMRLFACVCVCAVVLVGDGPLAARVHGWVVRGMRGWFRRWQGATG